MASNETNGDANGLNGHSEPAALCKSAAQFLEHEYDFIVIGGGTAGLVVASRLTEDPNVTVGVLEAGKNKLNDPLVDVPGAVFNMYNNPDYDWAFMTEPQKHNRNKVQHIPRGKVLGGSSAINYMMYVRGSDQDYDDWAAIVDDPSWGAKAMKLYMRKHQTLEPIDESILDRSTIPLVGENHGTSGPVRTSFNPVMTPIDDAFIRACDDVTGYNKKPKDPWSGDHIGFFNTLGCVARSGANKGKRSYAARGYFEANSHRSNLHVLCQAPVTSIELDGSHATGARFSFGGESFTVKAKCEVILSCGVIQSPQILELSGVGDPAILEKVGIECKIENRGVGENLQDHPIAVAGWELLPGHISADILHTPEVMAAAQEQYAETQSGPLTCIGSMQGFFPYKIFATQSEQEEIVQSIQNSMQNATSFVKKQYQQILQNVDDDQSAIMQLVLMGLTMNFDGGLQDQSHLWVPPKTPESPHRITVGICLQYPLSRGTVHVKSADPNEYPALDPAFCSHPADMAMLATALRLLDRVPQSKHLQGTIGERVAPDPNVDLSDMEQAKRWVEDWIMSEYHPCGSCAMGDVLDTRLRVKGASGLRVVDASIFPNHVSGNIMSSVYMVAEKASDMIKQDWGHTLLA